MGVSSRGKVKAFWLLLLAGFSCFAHSSGTVCPTDNLDPAQCGPITTKIVLAKGTLAFFDIPANPALGTAAVNAAYFSPDGFNLEGNGGSTVSAYAGSLKIESVVPVNGGVDTLFADGSVYFSPNGQNLGGGCSGSICTTTAYSSAKVPVVAIVPAGGGVDAVLMTRQGIEKAYFSPDGLDLGGGGNSVAIYSGGVSITQITPVDSSAVVAWFNDGAAYYSPNNRNIGGGGSTVSAYGGSIAIARIVKIGGGLLTQFQNNAVYLSPNGRNLGGGGSTVAVANWVHASNAPFPVRDSGKGAVFNGRLFLSGGFYPEADVLFDLWSTETDESGNAWRGPPPIVECLDDMPSPSLRTPGCWDAFSDLEVWNSTLWAIGSSVWSSMDGTHWTEQATPRGEATPTMSPPDENEHAAALGPYLFWMSLDSDPTDVQRTSNPNGTPWLDLNQIETSSNSPVVMTPRCGAAVFVLEGRVWIEGGRDGSKIWTPAGSDDHITSAACDASPDYTNDAWSSPDGITWAQNSTPPAWAPRQWPCVAADSTGTVWLVGGYVADFASQSSGEIRYATNLADVWYTKDGTTWKQFKADTGSELPDDLSSGIEPRHAPTCYVDTANNRLVVVAGKVTRQPAPNPPYPPNVAPVPNHDSGNVSNDVRILPLPDPSTLP
jgi:hypothetical protein